MFGFLGAIADAVGGTKVVSRSIQLEDKVKLHVHLKERKGRRYLHFRFSDGDNHILEAENGRELLRALKSYHARM
jgi:hypothetical protein